MFFGKKFWRTLSEIVDLVYYTSKLSWILHKLFPFDLFLIGKSQKDIIFLFTALILAKNEVNP